jgi:Leucine-rich repeat (LRR) protein
MDMKNLSLINGIILAFFIFPASKVNAQVAPDSSLITSIDEALKNPEKVYRLDLSNQAIKMPSDSIWEKFTNLEYLSFKNDHLTNLPDGISKLKRLKILDLSGNDFKVLPQSLSMLENLQELYLNDEKKMDVTKSLFVIKDLPSLRILHLENDHLKSIPKNLVYFKNLDTLYLNNNRLKQAPIELKELRRLKYVDLHDNKYKLKNQSLQDLQNEAAGLKIRF